LSTPTLETPKRGDIFWAELPPEESVGNEQRERRPVLVISSNVVNDALREEGCVAIPLSRQVHKAATARNIRIIISEQQKPIEPGTTGSKGDSVALTEQIRFVSRDRMDAKRVAYVTPFALGRVEAAIRFVLAIP
jgi:mRNA-degrading endonuclease toxin of MazEF toxin-antitoxin module